MFHVKHYWRVVQRENSRFVSIVAGSIPAALVFGGKENEVYKTLLQFR